MSDRVSETMPLLPRHAQADRERDDDFVWCGHCEEQGLDHHAQHQPVQDRIRYETIYNYNPMVADAQQDWNNGTMLGLIEDMQGERARWRPSRRAIKGKIEDLYNALIWS